MILAENGKTTIKGNPQEITKEWYKMTLAVIDGLESQMGTRITIEELIAGAEMLINQDKEEELES